MGDQGYQTFDLQMELLGSGHLSQSAVTRIQASQQNTQNSVSRSEGAGPPQTRRRKRNPTRARATSRQPALAPAIADPATIRRIIHEGVPRISKTGRVLKPLKKFMLVVVETVEYVPDPGDPLEAKIVANVTNKSILLEDLVYNSNELHAMPRENIMSEDPNLPTNRHVRTLQQRPRQTPWYTRRLVQTNPNYNLFSGKHLSNEVWSWINRLYMKGESQKELAESLRPRSQLSPGLFPEGRPAKASSRRNTYL